MGVYNYAGKLGFVYFIHTLAQSSYACSKRE
jgi:hypothetical protein